MARKTSVFTPRSEAKKSSHVPGGPISSVECPPGQNLIVQDDGMSYCGNNKESKIIRDLKASMSKLNSMLKKSVEYADVTDIVSPYVLTPVEKKTLQVMFGPASRQVAMNAALRRSGIVNDECPPEMEKYIDIVKNKMQCRPKFRRIIKAEEKDFCRSNTLDPLAIEPYVAANGQLSCRRPVVRGQFECPPNGFPEHTQMVVLPDGTGMCVEPSWSLNQKAYIADQLIYPRALSNQIGAVVQMIEAGPNLSPDNIREMHSELRNLKGQTAPLRNYSPATTQLLASARARFNAEPDVRILNHGLFEYARQHSPGIFKSGIPTMEDAYTWMTGA